jgi:hypothetical protein
MRVAELPAGERIKFFLGGTVGLLNPTAPAGKPTSQLDEHAFFEVSSNRKLCRWCQLVV